MTDDYLLCVVGRCARQYVMLRQMLAKRVPANDTEQRQYYRLAVLAIRRRRLWIKLFYRITRRSQ